jgi:hypothetical protein
MPAMPATVASMVEVTQIAFQTDFNVGATTNYRILPEGTMAPAFAFDNRDGVRPQGRRYPTTMRGGREWATSPYNAPLDFNEITIPIANLFGDPTAGPTQQNGNPAYLYKWTSNQSGIVTPKNATIQRGSSLRAQQVRDFYLNQLAFAFNRQTIDVTGAGMAKPIEDAITLASGVDVTELVPANADPAGLDVWLDATAANIGTTQVEDPHGFNFGIANYHGPVWAMKSSEPSWKKSVNLVPALTARGEWEANSEGMAYLPLARSKAKRFLRIKCQGVLLGALVANVYETFQLDCCCQFQTGEAFADIDGVKIIPWNLNVVHDQTWGKAWEITVINGRATL